MRLCHRPTVSTLVLAAWLWPGVGLAAPSAPGGESVAATYGKDGELYQVLSGSYGDLFPEGGAGVPDSHSVLALDISRAESSERLLVPGTEGAEVDTETRLVFVPASGRLHLLWASRVDAQLSRLNLVGLADGQWTGVIEVSGNPLPLKGSPQLSITRDAYGPDHAQRDRTVVHLLWWEEGAPTENVFYTPIVLLDGEYVGWNPVVLLNDFDAHGAVQPLPVTSSLFQAASLERGDDDQAVVIGLPLRRSLRLLTLEIRVLPSSLLALADAARSHIVGVGANVASGSILSLADSARSHIVGVGANLHEGVLAYVAEQGYIEVLSHGPTFSAANVETIADQLWLKIVESGASLIANELGKEIGECTLVQLAGTGTAAGTVHQLQACVVADLPAPVVGSGPTTLFVSETGADALAVWQQGANKLRYRRSLGDGWSTAETANLGEGVDIDGALMILRELVRTP